MSCMYMYVTECNLNFKVSFAFSTEINFYSSQGDLNVPYLNIGRQKCQLTYVTNVQN